MFNMSKSNMEQSKEKYSNLQSMLMCVSLCDGYEECQRGGIQTWRIWGVVLWALS